MDICLSLILTKGLGKLHFSQLHGLGFSLSPITRFLIRIKATLNNF